jgi:hypothetical protein
MAEAEEQKGNGSEDIDIVRLHNKAQALVEILPYISELQGQC